MMCPTLFCQAVPGQADDGRTYNDYQEEQKQMAIVTMKALLEAGVHFGHRTRRWNPKMKSYIFTERNGIHIIDLQQTVAQLEKAYALVRDTVSKGGIVLFVGTKRQAQETIEEQAKRCGMPYVNERWLGGTLTNWVTIRRRIDKLIEMEQQLASGEFSRLTKKEALSKQRLIAKLQRRLGGLRNMHRLPDIVFITDTTREELAVKEAKRLGIPIIAMVDTNSDPDPIDICIPSNDDAIRAIKLIVGKIADAVIEGQNLRATLQAEAEEEEEIEEIPEAGGDERYLAPGLLARVKAGEFGGESEFEDEDEDEEWEDEDIPAAELADDEEEEE
jgi:small subunit ribosomal protein S2